MLNVEKYIDWICHELAQPRECSMPGICEECVLYKFCGKEKELKKFMLSKAEGKNDD